LCLFDGAQTSISRFFQFYKSYIKLKSDSDGNKEISLKINNEVTNSPKRVAMKFNEHFSSLTSTSTLDKKASANCVLSLFKSMHVDTHNTFNFAPVTAPQIELLIGKLDNKSVAGISDIPTRVLKSANRIISPLLAELFNACIFQSIFPNEWKMATITPLFKCKGDCLDPNNYRRIAILPPIAKVFERLLAKQLSMYFVENKLFFNGQHGFRQNHSCETALHELLTTCHKKLEKK
jgi:hypothetical protein